MADTLLIDYTSGKFDPTFTVKDKPTILVVAGLGPDEEICVEQRVGCAKPYKWSTYSVAPGCPACLTATNTRILITGTGRYRLSASESGAEFATPDNICVMAQEPSELECNVTIPVPQKNPSQVEFNLDPDTKLQVQQCPVDEAVVETCPVGIGAFPPGTYTAASLGLLGSQVSVEFSAQTTYTRATLQGGKALPGSTPAPLGGSDTECAVETRTLKAPNEFCTLGDWTLVVSDGEVEVSVICRP